MDKANLIKLLESKGIAVSSKREKLLELLCEMGEVADITEFWLRLRLLTPISWATTYNFLRIMAQNGMLEKTSQDARNIRYRLLGEK